MAGEIHRVGKLVGGQGEPAQLVPQVVEQDLLDRAAVVETDSGVQSNEPSEHHSSTEESRVGDEVQGLI